MAARMTDIVKQRGRAYRCLTCNITSRKCRIEEHFFKRHVTEHQVPFLCSVCEFRTSDNAKFVRHQESPGHMARVEPLENLVALQESSTPRYMVMGQDVVKPSKEESSEHWLSVGWMQVDDEEAKEEEEVEDLRPQLLRHEAMQLTPPQSQKVSRSMATDATALTHELRLPARRIRCILGRDWRSRITTLASCTTKCGRRSSLCILCMKT